MPVVLWLRPWCPDLSPMMTKPTPPATDRRSLLSLFLGEVAGRALPASSAPEKRPLPAGGGLTGRMVEDLERALIRPGVTAFSLGRGHWANGSSDMQIDGSAIAGDARRATGVHGNAAMRLDDHLGNTCLIDPVGGSVSFYDTRVKLVKET